MTERQPVAAEAQVVAWRTVGRRMRYAWIQLFPPAAYMGSRFGIGHRRLVPLHFPYRWWVGLRDLL